MKGLEKPGYAKTGADAQKLFKHKNASLHLSVHSNCLADFLVKLYIGAAYLAKSLTNFR